MNLCQGISTASLQTHNSLLYIVSVCNKTHFIVFRSSRTILEKLSKKSARKALTFVIPCFSLAPSCLPRRFLRQLPRESSSYFESSYFHVTGRPPAGLCVVRLRGIRRLTLSSFPSPQNIFCSTPSIDDLLASGTARLTSPPSSSMKIPV